MINYIGVDGCRAGWFAVGFGDSDEWDIGVFPNIRFLYEQYSKARLILIDIPIGLKNERTCDKEVRKMLGKKRGSSVFPVPCRSVMDVDSYKNACLLNRQLSGRAISKQVWQIAPKILEIDEFIRCSRRSLEHLAIRETHPEICFRALAGHPMQYGKKTKAGFKERLRVLRMVFSNTDDIINEAKMRYRRKDVATDDILDALAIAVIARMGVKKLVSIPENPEYDSYGLRMEIVCAMR